MTVSVEYGFNLDRDAIIRQGLFLAGVRGQQADAELIDFVSDALNVEIKALQRYIVLSATERYSQPGALQALQTFPADSLDILEPISWTPVGQDTEVAIGKIVRETYMRIPDKETVGFPAVCYVEKGLSVTALLWPIPSTAGTLNVLRDKLLRDLTPGSNPDLKPMWLKTLCWAAASIVAASLNLADSKVNFCNSQYLAARQQVIDGDQERGDFQFYMEKC